MIRPARRQDAVDICALWNSIIRETTITFTTVLKEPDEVETLVDDPLRSVLVAETAGEFAGFALINPFRSGPGYRKTVEHTVYLLPDAFGKGFGRALMDRLAIAVDALGHHVMVGAISGNNSGAVKFHLSLGFEKVAHMPQVGRKFGQWQDLILMQKTLDFATDTLDIKG